MGGYSVSYAATLRYLESKDSGYIPHCFLKLEHFLSGAGIVHFEPGRIYTVITRSTYIKLNQLRMTSSTLDIR